MAFQQSTDNPIRQRFTGLNSEEIASWTVNFADTFDLNYLYAAFHQWLLDEGWVETKDDWDFPEVRYIHKEGAETRVFWRLSKKPKPDYKGFFKYYLDLDFAFFGIKETEAVVKGQKVKAHKGAFELIASAHLVIDKEGAWGKGILRNFKDLFYKNLISQKYLEHQNQLYEEAYRLRDFVIRYAKLQAPWLEEEGAEYYLKRTQD